MSHFTDRELLAGLVHSVELYVRESSNCMRVALYLL